MAEQGPGDTATHLRGNPTGFTSQGRHPVNSTFKLKPKGGTLLEELPLGKVCLETARMTVLGAHFSTWEAEGRARRGVGNSAPLSALPDYGFLCDGKGRFLRIKL